jgi:hypothetical protein
MKKPYLIFLSAILLIIVGGCMELKSDCGLQMEQKIFHWEGGKIVDAEDLAEIPYHITYSINENVSRVFFVTGDIKNVCPYYENCVVVHIGVTDTTTVKILPISVGPITHDVSTYIVTGYLQLDLKGDAFFTLEEYAPNPGFFYVIWGFEFPSQGSKQADLDWLADRIYWSVDVQYYLYKEKTE